MKTKFYALLLGVLTISLIGCAAPSPTFQSQPRTGLAPAAPPAPASADAAKEAAGRSTAGLANTSVASAERMIVRTVRVGLEVQDTEKAFNEITAIAAQYKGYVAQTNLSRDSKNRLHGTVTLRIPAESLDKAMTQIKAAGLKVLTENSNANDVTDQYTDLNARLKNLEATETELQKLLVTVRERTGKAEEILAVFNRLSEIRAQIEQVKGQINVIDRTTALATVTLELVPQEEISVIDPERWVPNRTAAQALRALIQALQGIADLAIWLILFVLPVLIVLALPFVLFVWFVRVWMRRRAKNKATTTA